MKLAEYKRCKRCIMDTSDPKISFNKKGICSHCESFENSIIPAWSYFKNRNETNLYSLLDEIRKRKKSNSKYDCIVGISGGVDSSYVVYKLKEWELKPLIVHVDAGWNSELAVDNIYKVVEYSGFDLETIVIDWSHFKKVQLAFLKSGVANQDIPQDHVFFSGLYKIARREKIKSIVSGSNYATESILPISWGYDATDRNHLKDICLKHGAGRSYRKIPTTHLHELLITYPYIDGILTFSPLNYIDYSKSKAIKELQSIGWRYYGGKHYESRWTHFFQSYYLPKRFGFDKRLAHLSSLVLNGEISRNQALLELEKPLFDIKEIKQDMEFIARKLSITISELEDLINKTPLTDYTEYKNWGKIRNIFYNKYYALTKKFFSLILK